MPRGKKRRDLTGQRFNEWTVLGFSHKDKHLKLHWHVRCDCGHETTAQGTKITTGGTKRCQNCANKRRQFAGLLYRELGK